MNAFVCSRVLMFDGVHKSQTEMQAFLDMPGLTLLPQLG